MATSDEHKMLATRLGGEYARMVLASLPRVGEALERDVRQASFSVTAEFRYGRGDQLLVTLKPRERIPLASVEIKLSNDDGQLSLFQGTPVDPEVEEPDRNDGAET